ncbi:hypothetical protein AAMO2058_001616500 [Amorphochlora amoebiformis]
MACVEPGRSCPSQSQVSTSLLVALALLLSSDKPARINKRVNVHLRGGWDSSSGSDRPPLSTSDEDRAPSLVSSPNIFVPASLREELKSLNKRFSRLDLDSEKSEKTSEVFPENVEKKRGKKKKAWRRLFPKEDETVSDSENRHNYPLPPKPDGETTSTEEDWRRFFDHQKERLFESSRLDPVETRRIQMYERDTPHLALVALLREPQLNELHSWVWFHVMEGFRSIFLYFDDPKDPAIQWAKATWPGSGEGEIREGRALGIGDFRVYVFACDDAYYATAEKRNPRLFSNLKPFFQTDVPARQIIAADQGLHEAVGLNATWLAHVSGDQFLYFRSDGQYGSALSYFRTVGKRINLVRFLTKEAISPGLRVMNRFWEMRLFKNNPLQVIGKEVEQDWPETKTRTGSLGGYFLAQSYVKSAVRVSKSVEPLNIYEFSRRPNGLEDFRRFSLRYLVPPVERWGEWEGKVASEPDGEKTDGPDSRTGLHARTEMCASIGVLHYINGGFTQWIRKYRRLGNFSDFLFGEIPLRLQFPKDSRKVIFRNNTRQMAHFYLRMMATTASKEDVDTNANLTLNGVLRVITDVVLILESAPEFKPPKTYPDMSLVGSNPEKSAFGDRKEGVFTADLIGAAIERDNVSAAGASLPPVWGREERERKVARNRHHYCSSDDIPY